MLIGYGGRRTYKHKCVMVYKGQQVEPIVRLWTHGSCEDGSAGASKSVCINYRIGLQKQFWAHHRDSVYASQIRNVNKCTQIVYVICVVYMFTSAYKINVYLCLCRLANETPIRQTRSSRESILSLAISLLVMGFLSGSHIVSSFVQHNHMISII